MHGANYTRLHNPIPLPRLRQSAFERSVKYISKYWGGLCLFLTDSRIEVDNNAVEHTIRAIALNRKNVLFAGHDAG